MKYEYKTHAAYRGYGWIEPLTDPGDSLIEDYVARRICDELNALQDEIASLRVALEQAQTGLRYVVRVYVLSDEIKWSEEKIDEVVESIISDAKKEADRE